VDRFAIAFVLSATVWAQQPRFRDVAPQALTSYRTNNGGGVRKYFPQPMCGGVALADFDGDGRLDIFFTNGAALPSNRKDPALHRNLLLRNLGGGRFANATASAGLGGETLGYSLGPAAADFDNDGDSDLFVANLGANTLYRNDGTGRFTDISKESGLDLKPAGTISVGAAWFDYDQDGLLDIAVAQYTEWSPGADIRCRQSDGTGIYCDPRKYRSIPSRLYRNLGGGRFADVSEAAGWSKYPGKAMGLSVADFNGDGAPDVFVANDTERNHLFINRGEGRFEEAALQLGAAYNESGNPVSSMGTDARDVDNDGRPDIFYNALAGQFFALFRNLGAPGFQSLGASSAVERLSRAFSGWSAAIADFDNDGWKDLYSANGHVDNVGEGTRHHDTLWRNRGDGKFEDVSSEVGADFLRAGYQRGAVWGDLNDDGALDLVVTSLGQRPRILLSPGPLRHWLRIKLEGRRSNRDGLDAAIEVRTGTGRRLFNHVTTSVGFLSSADPSVHFGLGDEARIESIRVRWPSGSVQELKGGGADRTVRIQESEQ
jgi:enediyne biosynthesis protein E4